MWKQLDRRRFSLDKIFKLAFIFYFMSSGIWNIVTMIWFWMNGFCFFTAS